MCVGGTGIFFFLRGKKKVRGEIEESYWKERGHERKKGEGEGGRDKTERSKQAVSDMSTTR